MKKIRRIISLILASMMICSMVCNASAYSEDHIRHTWVEEYFPEGGGCLEKPHPSEDGQYCFYDGWFVTKCSECPEILRQEWKELYRDHDFVGNVCSECGYTATNKNNNQSRSCAHRNLEEYMIAGNVFNNEYNGKCVQEGYFIKYCPDCDTQLTEPESIKRIESEHIFKNGKCTVCHYELDKQEEVYVCKHNNTDETFTGNISTTEDGVWHKGYFIRYCKDCHIEISQPQYDERFVAHKFDGNGKCKQCGYIIQEEERTAWVYNTEGDNLLLRSSAGKTTILARMPEYSQITVIGNNTTNGYYKVKYNNNNISGWAHSDYITFSKVEQPTVNDSSYILPFSGMARVTVLDWYWGKSSAGAHPTKGSGNVRGAIDFAVTGSALATASGTVAEARSGYNSGWGNYVTLRHDDGTYSFYAHLANFSVSANQKVSQGQAIGTIGSTGNSTGTHLHFEIWDSAKRTIYTIDALKPHKERLRFDSDVVSGGSNSSAIRNWITSNYTLSNGVYVPKATSVVGSTTNTSKPTTPQQTTQTVTASPNKKVNFVQSQISSWQSLLESKKQAAESCISVCNEVNARLSIQQALGVSISAVTTLKPTKLFAAVDEDVALYTLAAIINNEYKTIADSNYYAFLENKNKITNDSEATKVYTYFVEALASYDFILKGTYDTVSQFATGGEYTKRMLDKFVLGLVEGYVESDVVKLKKIADTVQNMSSLLETIKNKSVGLKQYHDTKKQWQAIWNKL